MKIYYIVNARIPTEKAHGYQIAKMCEEFGKSGIETELLLPDRDNPIKEDIFEFYGLKKYFKPSYVKCFDAVRFARLLGRLAFKIQTVVFLRALVKISIDKDSIIYSRDADIIHHYKKEGYTTVYDAHNFSTGNISAFLKNISGVSGIVANSSGTANEFTSRGFKRVLVAPNGVDAEKFHFDQDKMSLRETLNLPKNKKIVMYVGHLYSWKGAYFVLDLAEALNTRNDIQFVMVGGNDKDVEGYRKEVEQRNLHNITLVGHVKRAKIPFYLKSSDILLLPNLPVSRESEFYTSPIKMFEYMASGVPIVASDMPSIREVLDKETAYLANAGDKGDFVESIVSVVENLSLAKKKSEAALERVEAFSWSNRAAKIIKFISKI